MSDGDGNGASAIRRVIDQRLVKVVYQPVVDLQTHKIFAYEALARPTAPDFDGPLELFAAAVERARAPASSGACSARCRSRAATTHPLFLNIHPAELNERWLVQPDDPIFQHTEDVYLEITEGVPLSHFQLCQTILHEVRGRGVHLVVDDLGAGYSNLKYIADLHPRVVKLDRELVAGLTRGLAPVQARRARSSAVQGARRHRGRRGHRDRDELEAVIEAGARFGQGYLLARPAFPPPTVTWPDMPRRRTTKFSRSPVKRSEGTGLARPRSVTRNPPRGRS